MKIKHILIPAFAFLGCLVLFFLVLLFAVEEEEDGGSGGSGGGGKSGEIISDGGKQVSDEVLAHKELVVRYCREFGISDYVNHILAIIQVESGGTLPDVMQCSESLGLPPNSLGVEASIKQGCSYFSQLLHLAKEQGCDENTAIQAYNYGGGFIPYVESKGKQYTFELAQAFAKEKSGGKRIGYRHEFAVAKNGGWRYQYGNMFYVLLIREFLASEQFDEELVQKVMEEAVKYEGWKYVFGGAAPETSFDCSGLTGWCFAKAGINLPRTAQEQYNVTQHLPLADAQAGDLVFFHSTYATANYITHVGIYLGNQRMYHAGDPIGYADLHTPYWQAHLVSAGRVRRTK